MNNIVYGKYISVIHEKGSYEELMNRYYSSHKRCPKCGSISNTQTLVAYLLDPNNYDSYQDKNRVDCCDCNWTGIVHDLI